MLLISVLLWVGFGALVPSTECHSLWEGTWIIKVAKEGYDKTLNCGFIKDPIVREFKVTLTCPNEAVDEFGNKGHWTSIFDYGIEIVVQGRKFYSFPFKRWGGLNDTKDGYSYNMPNGWSHDLLGNNWACFYGVSSYGSKMNKSPSQPLRFEKKESSDSTGTKLFQTDHVLISAINQAQSFWTATKYPQFENLTMDEMINLAGGKSSLKIKFPEKTTPKNNNKNASYPTLPVEFDWRNVNDINFVSPIRNQGRCGSCYAFAATAMHESRVRIRTGNKLTPTFSPQDLVDCSPYANGCHGGYLFGEAKFAEDFGFAEETCSPYKGYENACTSVKSCRRSYATDYEFIGDTIGGCSEPEMRRAIYENGPIVVGYMVFHDFLYYKSGIYYHYGYDRVMGGHAVSLVGWGEDAQTGTKYWIAKNSWGSNWGENGYFRIIRGIDECHIESLAWQATPIL